MAEKCSSEQCTQLQGAVQNLWFLRKYGRSEMIRSEAWPLVRLEDLRSVVSVFPLCTPGHSIPADQAARWRTQLQPLQPSSGRVPPDHTLGWGKLNTSFNFCPVFARQSQGSCWGYFPWRAVGQHPAKERGRILEKGDGHGAPARPAQCGPLLPPLSLRGLIAIRSTLYLELHLPG